MELKETNAGALLLKNRITSIDLLRGVIMIIMALDHVRDYFHADVFFYDPLDLDKASPWLFFTRWITHYCAPVFMLLSGTSAFLMGQRKTKKQLSLFLLTRGLWLVLLEMTVVNFGWTFNIAFPSILFLTIWALGISMICLAGLVFLPKKIILLIAIILISCHNLLDDIHIAGNTLPAFGWSLLHDQQFFQWNNEIVLVGYPIIPWPGVMALGYCLGGLYTSGYDAGKRKKYLLRLGIAGVALFIIIRFINVYGDNTPWTQQSSSLYTFLSFIKVTKYPPSLLYVLMTISPALIFLALTENWKGAIVRFVSVYGRVPMFYYILHIYLIHLLAMTLSTLFTGMSWQKWILVRPIWFSEDLKGAGFSLPVVYLVWAAVVIVLYPLCKRYDHYKQTHKDKWWLSYL
jgi:uncharacterized membrane protein